MAMWLIYIKINKIKLYISLWAKHMYKEICSLNLIFDGYLKLEPLVPLNQSTCPVYDDLHMMRIPTFVAYN
jgi:hypothetical protein